MHPAIPLDPKEQPSQNAGLVQKAISLLATRKKPEADTDFIERAEELEKANEALRAEIMGRNRAQEALRESEEKFRAFMETTHEWIWAIDREGYHTYSNPAVHAILGYTPEEILGQKCLTFLHEEDREQFAYMLPIFMADKWGWKDLVLRWRHKDGTYRYLERNATPILDAAGEALGYCGTDRDITERKRVEQALAEERASLARRVEDRTAELSAANAQLAKAARLKDEFLASMSHELRTPLNAVLGLSESLQEQIYGQLNEKQLGSLRSIEESGRHLLSLINDILDLFKVEAGKIQLQIDSVSVSSVCQASLRLIKEAAQKKRLQVSTTFDGPIINLPADERRLKQILVNLLSNAVKFTPEGGKIGIDVTRDDVQEVVKITVWDTGVGILQEDLPRLFQPFVQLDSRLSRQYAGTGLGLALVRRMVEMHSGKVTVESEVGKGSRFIVMLPAKPEELAMSAAPEPVLAPHLRATTGTHMASKFTAPLGHSADGSSKLILLAEDNEMNIETVSDYLHAKGYRITIARSGTEAIQRAQEDKPDLILMDIQMPDLDGLEATRRIRSDSDVRLARTPIIAVTALAMPGDRERCLQAGANDYFSKPVNFREMLAAIETHTASELRAIRQ
jgi:PAS domain S-box-containing protein